MVDKIIMVKFKKSSIIILSCVIFAEKTFLKMKMAVNMLLIKRLKTFAKGKDTFIVICLKIYSNCTLYGHPKKNRIFSPPYTRHRTPKMHDHYPCTVDYI